MVITFTSAGSAAPIPSQCESCVFRGRKPRLVAYLVDQQFLVRGHVVRKVDGLAGFGGRHNLHGLLNIFLCGFFNRQLHSPGSHFQMSVFNRGQMRQASGDCFAEGVSNEVRLIAFCASRVNMIDVTTAAGAKQ